MTQSNGPITRAPVHPIIKVALTMMILGLITAAIAAGVTYHLNSQQPIDRKAFQLWSRTAIWVWPSGMMMTAADSSSPVLARVILVISIIANGCLYALAGVVIGAIWQKLAGAARQ
jgi:hypothetical protein